MVEMQIDGVKVEMPEGSMVMDAVKKVGKYVPHFCYHKKLSIAASCRMCLVEVEKALKPLPACATPVTPGMVVRTQVESTKAATAQKDVMEFLLLNHPLDCPICDQGGECQLQDLAVGYGKSSSRYQEEKRTVQAKEVGPLISMEEMARCIHCTRCVRFGQEVAGVMELGMLGRGEHAEITTFVGNTVNSELSGNMIDLCPVGAITSKPYRYSARNWELSRRKTVSAHDSLGSNLIVQVKDNQVKRVLPLENVDVNDCWISDRDRFAYEGLHTQDRVSQPMIKRDGQWHNASWEDAFAYVVEQVKTIKGRVGADKLGALASNASTVEELYMLKALMNGLGSSHIDVNLRQSDAALPSALTGTPCLAMPITAFNDLHVGLFVGTDLREEHPLLTARLRQAAKRNAKINVLSAHAGDLLMVANQKATAPSQWLKELLAVEVALSSSDAGDKSFTAQTARALTDARAKNKSVVVGSAVMNHPQAAQLLTVLNRIAATTGATLSILAEGANTLGAYAVGAVAKNGSLNAMQMLAEPRDVYFLLNVEPQFEAGNPAQAARALANSFVVAMNANFSAVADYADVILPVTPFTETAGTFVNTEGRVQAFNPVTKPFAQSRPAWKVLRVLGEQFGLSNDKSFAANDIADVRGLTDAILLNGAAGRSNTVSVEVNPIESLGLERSGRVAAYGADAITRRAQSLQKTEWAQSASVVGLSTNVYISLGLQDLAEDSAWVIVTQDGLKVKAQAVLRSDLGDNVVDIQQGSTLAAQLGSQFGSVSVERA
ncbi:NADH-quinone oxidoreductase subunit NuoG [Hydromonas duriensis]|uniref:NADH-quinone oxidoreductase n=1 Tax=Hydromonas duriensis TaxID=1527608 RepID=A0A4R6Y933_9BURK|nr:NADH-quinone oxidoreductase subunit NuoG [Hydromonas duriensis]TDR31951.1 NADH dehydrogenase subunit G [Hydromonas duriensis]